ncbi:retrotransposon ORF1 [Tanacetum coccineum]|uniref:Retrotransposon ORF1 n=1 Tax=Tanacetum coccineum TaxID=301880 RepID=A0ABQ5B861_9ASTR
MRELRCKLFKGVDDEDAHEHVWRVLEIVDLFHFPSITHDAVMLRVFPITLKGSALRWINKLSAGLVTTWDFLEKAFIRQYCPSFKTAKKLDIIRNVKQEMDETLYHAWKRCRPTHDKEKVVKEEEQDYDIPLQDGVMQALTPQTVHITPSDDDHVALGTNPILNKKLNEFREEFFDITRVAKKANGN